MASEPSVHRSWMKIPDEIIGHDTDGILYKGEGRKFYTYPHPGTVPVNDRDAMEIRRRISMRKAANNAAFRSPDGSGLSEHLIPGFVPMTPSKNQ